MPHRCTLHQWRRAARRERDPAQRGERMGMAEPGNASVHLLEADPDLARGLDPRRVREMSQRLVTRAMDIPRGPWTPQRHTGGGSQPIGLLVLDGLLVREATVGDHPSA